MEIAPESTAFLTSLFTDLRKDLAKLAGATQGSPDPEKAARDLAIFDSLPAGLAPGGAFPDDEDLLEYAIGLAKATDEANGYEQAALEHRALAELVRALKASG